MFLSFNTGLRASCFLLAALAPLQFVAAATVKLDETNDKVRAAYDAGIETQQQFEIVSNFISANDEETKWQEIPWLPSLGEGIQLANEKKKPLFVWAMNGDPLGCV
jgi:hypothetical protein